MRSSNLKTTRVRDYSHLGKYRLGLPGALALVVFGGSILQSSGAEIGWEISVPNHLPDGQEYQVSTKQLIEHGQLLFSANWTYQEGGGRPLTKGTGAPLADPLAPLVFPRNMNRISGPDANSCAGCHNAPHGISGGGGDFVANVFVLGQRFDFATFDRNEAAPTKGAFDERGNPVTSQTIANSRTTLGMFGSGYIEMLARQITGDLQTLRNTLSPGESVALVSKGISYGSLSRRADGSWNTTSVIGIPDGSLGTVGTTAPSLVLKPFHQAGRVISVREFSNNAFNHHHGIQSTERFGVGTDPDGDGVINELTRADVTAAVVFQVTMAVPGRVIPKDPAIERAVIRGESKFQAVGCAACHIPTLPLGNQGWVFSEPNPFNAAGNLRPGDAPALQVDLNDSSLPHPRLKDVNDVVHVPAFTDLRVHDITGGINDPNREVLNMQHAPGSEGFFGGNGKFVTRKLWDVGNRPNHHHHGQFSTMRESIFAHLGDAQASRTAFLALSAEDQACVIEFLKTLQALPPGTKNRVVDEKGNARKWPPTGYTKSTKYRSGSPATPWLGSSGLYQVENVTFNPESEEDN